MNLCQTCAHWEKPEPYTTGYSQGVGRCKAVPMFWDCTKWNDNCERVLSSEFENVRAFVQDGSDYMAQLLTMPNFGCVMHAKGGAA